jgi:hypothetical protein
MARMRRYEILALVRHRHGGLPDTDDRNIYLKVTADHLYPRDGDLAFALEEWARRAGGAKPSKEEIERIASEVGRLRRRFKADTIADRLRVTDAERTALKLTTIGAIDAPKEERMRRRKERQRKKQEDRRRARGVMPRARYLAKSLQRKRPWLDEGISRAQWYRRRHAHRDVRQVRAQQNSSAYMQSTHLSQLLGSE